MGSDDDDDTDAREALQELRDDLDGLRTRLKQVPHPAAGHARAPGGTTPRPAGETGEPEATGPGDAPDRRQG